MWHAGHHERLSLALTNLLSDMSEETGRGERRIIEDKRPMTWPNRFQCSSKTFELMCEPPDMIAYYGFLLCRNNFGPLKVPLCLLVQEATNIKGCVILSGLRFDVAVAEIQPPCLHVAGTKIEPGFVSQSIVITYHKAGDAICIDTVIILS